jgi:hypothetical protein
VTWRKDPWPQKPRWIVILFILDPDVIARILAAMALQPRAPPG